MMENVQESLKELSNDELQDLAAYLQVAAYRSRLEGWFYHSFFRRLRLQVVIEMSDRLDGLSKMPVDDVLRLVTNLQLHRDDLSKSAGIRRFWANAMLDADDEKKDRWANRERADADMDAALEEILGEA